jgi:DNA-binding GntR family transcriptional regulator
MRQMHVSHHDRANSARQVLPREDFATGWQRVCKGDLTVPPDSKGAKQQAHSADPYLRVRQLLVRGHIRPGTRASESALAAHLDVSRTPVREAIHRLLAEGLLVIDGGGARPRIAAAPVGVADAEDVYQAAGALEGIVARRLDRLSLSARRSLAAEMRARHAAFRHATRGRTLDYDVVFRRHNAFHTALHDACATPTLRAMIDFLQPRLDRYEWLYANFMTPNLNATLVEHAAIIRAVAAGDAGAAERAVRANAFHGGARLVKALEAIARANERIK